MRIGSLKKDGRAWPLHAWVAVPLVAVVLALCATNSSAAPRNEIRSAPPLLTQAEQINASLNLTDSVVTSLQFDAVPGAPLRVPVPIAGELRFLDLVPQSTRSHDYQLLVQLPDGSYVSEEPGPVRTLRGEVAGLSGSRVAASLKPDGLHARVILPDGANWWVEPLASNVAVAGSDEYVIYRNDDVLPSGGKCIALEPPGWVANQDDNKRMVPAEDITIAELGIDTDYGYFMLFSREPDPVAAVEAAVQDIITAVNIQFERDVGIKHIITTIIVRPDIDDPYTGLDATALLNQFRDLWNTELSYIRRDLAQLLTERNLSGSTIGIAWVGQVCGNYAYSVIQPTCCEISACKTDLSAHELGHIWGAHHCGYDGPDDPDDCTPTCPDHTMNCNITCANQFHETITQPSILGHRDTRTCLVQGDELRRVRVLSDSDSVFEGTEMSFTAIADFRYSDDEDVTMNATWFLNRPLAGSVDQNGIFTAAEVESDTCLAVSASYTYAGVTLTGDKTIVVIDTDAPLLLVDSDPSDGAIDARQPSNPDGTGTAGWNAIELTFDGDACVMVPEDFEVTVEAGGATTPTVFSVEHPDVRSVRLVLSGPIEPGVWTDITHLPSGENLRLGSLPGDINNDGTTDVSDLELLIQHLEDPTGTPLATWQHDTDRSGHCTAADLLRLIDLLNGAGQYTLWNGASLP